MKEMQYKNKWGKKRRKKYNKAHHQLCTFSLLNYLITYIHAYIYLFIYECVGWNGIVWWVHGIWGAPAGCIEEGAHEEAAGQSAGRVLFHCHGLWPNWVWKDFHHVWAGRGGWGPNPSPSPNSIPSFRIPSKSWGVGSPQHKIPPPVKRGWRSLWVDLKVGVRF